MLEDKDRYGLGWSGEGYKRETYCAHGGRDEGMTCHAVNVPVVRASTILFDNLEALEASDGSRLRYGRSGTQSNFALRDWLKGYEGADEVWLTGSGMEAILFVLQNLSKSGREILVADNVYLPTKKICEKILRPRGVKVTYVDCRDVEDVSARLRGDVDMLFMEVPGSSTFEMADATRLAELCRENGVVSVLDHTWSAGYFYRPLCEGVDVAIQSASKYCGGHADVMMGVVSVKKGEVMDSLRYVEDVSAVSTSPDAAWLVLRGARTLSARMRRHDESAREMASWLERESMVAKVLYPGLESDEGYGVWKSRYEGGSGLMGVLLKGRSREGLASFVDHMELFGMGFSWGSFESLILPQDQARNYRGVMGFPEVSGEEETTLVRVHIGLEDCEDLKRDLSEGLLRWKKSMT